MDKNDDNNGFYAPGHMKKACILVSNNSKSER